MTQKTESSARSSAQVTILRGLLLVLSAGLLIVVFRLVYASAEGGLRDEAAVTAQSRVQALESVLAKQRAVAAILADDDGVKLALSAPSEDQYADISRKLDRLQAETQSAVIYLLDREGLAIAASNWDTEVSFVGSNYGFRDYFGRAIREGTALEFALGTVSHRPGLYLSHDVRGQGSVLGVVVVKVEFDAQEAAWARSHDETYVFDGSGEILLSSQVESRFGTLAVLPEGHLDVTVPVPGAGWRLMLVTSRGPALNAALVATGALAIGLFLIATGWRRAARARREVAARIESEARYRADLEEAVVVRTLDLEEQIRVRQAAEKRIARMHADLVQANKLATLGQVTAGVAHEVNQPLATIRLLAENGLALLPPRTPKDVSENLCAIVRMSDRIAQITTELRSFSRKATGETVPVRLKEVLEVSVQLTASRSRTTGAQIILPDADPDLKVLVEAVRLEQILVNLIQNAQEALSGHPDPQIRLSIETSGSRVVLSVADNGPGLTEDIAAQLFTPFATSKPDGLGLGLVISQSIVRDFGGELRADPPSPGKGAVFRLDLPGVP